MFSGIGGLRLGLEKAIPQSTVVEFVEIDPTAQHVYKSHFPLTPLHGDIRSYEPKQNWNYENGIVFGGFPCQNTSCAGNKKGLEGDKSGLWWEFFRVIKAARPAFVVIENPDGLRHRGLLDILRSLAEGGYDAEWQTISAGVATGAPHWRDRLFVVAYSNHISSRFKKSPGVWAKHLGEKIKEDINPNPFESRLKRGRPKPQKKKLLLAELSRANPQPRGENEQRRSESDDAIPPWLGGKASAEWCQKWEPPKHPGRPKKAKLGQGEDDFKIERWVNNKAISMYGNACVPEQAQIAFERVAYLLSLL